MNIGYGEKLKELRIQENILMKDVAKEIGVATSTYAGYEKEFRQPSFEILIKLADFYGVTVDYLLNRDQIPTLLLNGSYSSKLDIDELELMEATLKLIEKRRILIGHTSKS